MTEQIAADPIVTMANNHRDIIKRLEEAGEISLMLWAQNDFSKTLLLSAASYFEVTIVETVKTVFRDYTGNSEALVKFVEDKAASRGYSSWFDWGKRNANKFFASFGPAFSTPMKEKHQNEPDFKKSVESFMELGSLRNQLVHRDLAQFHLDKTYEEIFKLYEDASVFVWGFSSDIRAHIDESKAR